MLSLLYQKRKFYNYFINIFEKSKIESFKLKAKEFEKIKNKRHLKNRKIKF